MPPMLCQGIVVAKVRPAGVCPVRIAVRKSAKLHAPIPSCEIFGAKEPLGRAPPARFAP